MTTVPTYSGRRAELRRQRRRRRVRLLSAVLALALLVAAAVAVYLVRSAPVQGGKVAAQQRTQQTLLFQLQGENGSAIATSLLAHDPGSRTGAAVLIPPQVIVTVPGTGQLQLGRALRTVPPEGSRNAVADLLGVTVDAGWVVNVPTMAALVDALGGVQLDVDVPVVQSGSVVVEPGGQRLDGARAVAFARHLAPGEQEQARLARLQELLDGVLQALPRATAEVTATLNSLGQRSVPSIPLPRLAAFLVGLAGDNRVDQLQFDTLPVVAIDPGNGVTSFRVEPEGVRTLVDRLLAQSVPPSARSGGNRVLVLNGVGTPGLGDKVRQKLVPGGFVYVGARNAPRFGYEQTQILVGDATPQAQALGERIARAIGLPNAPVRTADPGSIADAIVLVGKDFKG